MIIKKHDPSYANNPTPAEMKKEFLIVRYNLLNADQRLRAKRIKKQYVERLDR